MQRFDENPILNSPYEMPGKHWALAGGGVPTGEVKDGRRISSYLVPIPAARQRARMEEQELFSKVETNAKVNSIRAQVDEWRVAPPEKWKVSRSTQRLLEHWRNRDKETSPKLFFCQIEAAETLIWLNEVAPHTKHGVEILREMAESNAEANPGLFRLAAKMATGAGKTMVMAMMIAYHAVNKARRPRSDIYADHFLVITPGITIKDRLRVLLPQDPDNYYEHRNIVPPDMRADIAKARIVIVNYQALRLRETVKISRKAREVLRGNDAGLAILETEGAMLARVCPELLRVKNAVIINDEAHHCYRSKGGGGGRE